MNLKYLSRKKGENCGGIPQIRNSLSLLIIVNYCSIRLSYRWLGQLYDYANDHAIAPTTTSISSAIPFIPIGIKGTDIVIDPISTPIPSTRNLSDHKFITGINEDWLSISFICEVVVSIDIDAIKQINANANIPVKITFILISKYHCLPRLYFWNTYPRHILDFSAEYQKIVVPSLKNNSRKIRFQKSNTGCLLVCPNIGVHISYLTDHFDGEQGFSYSILSLTTFWSNYDLATIQPFSLNLYSNYSFMQVGMQFFFINIFNYIYNIIYDLLFEGYKIWDATSLNEKARTLHSTFSNGVVSLPFTNRGKNNQPRIKLLRYICYTKKRNNILPDHHLLQGKQARVFSEFCKQLLVQFLFENNVSLPILFYQRGLLSGYTYTVIYNSINPLIKQKLKNNNENYQQKKSFLLTKIIQILNLQTMMPQKYNENITIFCKLNLKPFFLQLIRYDFSFYNLWVSLALKNKQFFSAFNTPDRDIQPFANRGKYRPSYRGRDARTQPATCKQVERRKKGENILYCKGEKRETTGEKKYREKEKFYNPDREIFEGGQKFLTENKNSHRTRQFPHTPISPDAYYISQDTYFPTSCFPTTYFPSFPYHKTHIFPESMGPKRSTLGFSRWKNGLFNQHSGGLNGT